MRSVLECEPLHTCDDELAIVLVFSLSGLDLSLWLLAKYATAGSAGLFSALPLQ
jgi:hypothetical protein